jgi:hypothetical protein
MNNLPQPPEGILDPQKPWHLPMPKSPGLWGTLKARLTGRPNEYGNYSSYVNITEADADRLIANMKKDPRGYPQLDQTSGTPSQWMERQKIYQEWLVEEYLEKPFREEVNEKIDAKTSNVLDRVFIEAKEEVKEAETKEEVVDILEDKKEILEDIQEKISPPPNEYQIPDPWEGSYTTPDPEKKKKRERRRLKRPKGVVKKRKRKPASPPGGGNEPPKPPRRKKTFASKLGGSVRKTGSSFGKSLLDKLEGGGPLGENMGPSVLSAGVWIGKKITKAFQDAKKERARAVEAEQNGAEVPPEMKEKGYFIKKSLAHQFGGEALNKTVGAFFESIPSKQSSKKAGFGDKFDYGDGDPKKKKQQNDIKDLATGFRKVTSSLRGINKNINQQIGLLSKLVGETSRVADTLEAIQNSIAKQIDVEIQTDADETQAQQATGGDINIGDINLDMPGEGGGVDWFDLLMAADDIRDFKNKLKGGGQRTTTRKPKVTGGAKPRSRFRMPSFGRRFKFSEGAASVGTQVPALIGEAGPEVLIRNNVKKLAEGGVVQGATSNILATGLGATGDLMKKVQPFANVMEMPFKVIGSQISGALTSLVAAAGPFSGAIAKMFSPLLGGLATIFGLNQGAFAGELNSAAMTEKEGAKSLSKFFADFFKLFGITLGGGEQDSGEEGEKDNTPENFSGGAGDWGPLLEIIRKAEGSWESISGRSPIKGLTDWTIQKIADAAPSYAGAYQLDPDSVIGWAKDVGLKPEDKFTPENQNKIAVGLIEGRAQGKKWQSKEISDQKFGNNLATIWAGLPVLSAINGKQRGSSYYAGVSWNKANATPEEVEAAFKKVSGGTTSAAKGTIQPITSSFASQVQGVFEIEGPDTGYKVPETLTGGQPVVGHGLEWLIKMSNKFIILPGVNKEYNVYKDPAKAFTRYEQIGNQGGVEVAGFVDFVDRIIFGPPHKGPSNVRYQSGPRDAIEAIGGKYYKPYAPDPSFKPVREASLPEAQVTPLAIPRDTVAGTTGTAVVAMVQPVVVEKIVTVPGPTTVEYVPANKYVAGKAGAEMLFLQTLS